MKYPSQDPAWSKLEVIICVGCGFGFVPKIDFDLGDYYLNSYGKTHGRRHIGLEFFDSIDSVETKKIVRARWHARVLGELASRLGRVVDVGAGPGFFLHYVDATEKFAVELDGLSLPVLKAKGVTVLNRVDDASAMDAVVMSHTLEHFMATEYRSAVTKCVDALSVGGLLLIEVPEWGRLDLRAPKSGGRGHEPHTLFFSPPALLSSVEISLEYFQQGDRIYEVHDGKVNWKNFRPKPVRASQLMGIWRKH